MDHGFQSNAPCEWTGILKLLHNSFSRRENCEPFCFTCNLSAFISQFQRLHNIRLCNIFGQEDHRPASPNVLVRLCIRVIRP